jgi:hypothetical protein
MGNKNGCAGCCNKSPKKEVIFDTVNSNSVHNSSKINSAILSSIIESNAKANEKNVNHELVNVKNQRRKTDKFHIKFEEDEKIIGNINENLLENFENTNDNEFKRKKTRKQSFKSSKKSKTTLININDSLQEPEIVLLEITTEDQRNILNVLKDNVLFKTLSEELFNNVIKEFEIFKFNKGSYLFFQGEDGVFFYIIKKGKVEYYQNEMLKENIEENKIIGEASLLMSSKREVSARCASDVEVYLINGNKFRHIQSEYNKKVLENRFYFFSLIPVLSKYYRII